MLKIMVQRATRKTTAPSAIQLRRWAKAMLRAKNISSAELTIRIVAEKEMTTLNSTYRQKNSTTNVLSFPFDQNAQTGSDTPLLGDIIVCAAVVNAEAEEQQKTAEAHWAHIIVHGTLHLLGHDHVKDDDAEVMETLEVKTLQTLGFNNPYDSTHKGKKS